MKVQIKGYKYNQSDFTGMDFETFVEKFNETFKDCDMESAYKLLTGCNPVLKDGKPKKSTKKTGEV